MSISGWIGVDLDGTLAYFDGNADVGHIGEPILLMANRVRYWLSNGYNVRIFTARASIPEQIPAIEEWCLVHFGRRLPVVNAKDFHMINLWDDKCIRVETNTGEKV